MKVHAIEQEDNRGHYNIWRLTPKTECLAFGIKAESEKDAISKFKVRAESYEPV